MEELRARVDAAVRAAERGTSGEIVPVLADASGDYRTAEILAGVAGALALLALAWLAYRVPEGDWGHGFPAAWIAGSLVAGFAAAWGAARAFSSVKRALVAPATMRAAVADAARDAFERFRVRRTAGGAGVLIYVSSFERMVRVEGDAAVCDWTEACDAVVAELKEGRLAEAFETGIARVGAALAECFLAGDDDPDELHNGLRVLLD